MEFRRHLSVLLRRLAVAANLPPRPFPPYCLRRGFITALAAAGLSPVLRSRFVGHKPPKESGESATHRKYVDPVPETYAWVNSDVVRRAITAVSA